MVNNFIIFLSIIGLTTLIISLRGTNQDQPESKPIEVKPSKPQPNSDLFSGMVLKIPGSEPNSYWELHVVNFESITESGKMNGVKGNYYQNKQVIYKISAKTGVIAWKTRILSLKGAVKFQSNDGKEITADEFVWDPNNKLITATSNVLLKVSQANIKTDSLKADLKLEKVVFSGVTRALYQR